MKITTNFSNPIFKGAVYSRGRTIDRADAMCRSIATELEVDKILKSKGKAGKDKQKPKDTAAKSKEADFDSETLPDAIAYPYDDSRLFLELRKITGIEKEPEAQEEEPFDIKQAFMLSEEKRQIDIKA